MDVTIILVNYNTKKLVSEAIDSVIEKTQGLEYQIIVVDNNSEDESYYYLQEKFGNRIMLIKNEENIGFGRANNIALERVNSKYVFLLNTDTLLVNNSIKIFYEYMEKHEEVAVCGGALYNLDMTPQISYGYFPTFFQAFFEEFQLHKIFKNYYNNNLSVGCIINSDEINSVDYISGADMFIRKSALDLVGNFDKDFFLYYEETELNYRMNKLGFKTVVIPDAKIIHLCGKSSESKLSLEKFKIMQTSKILFFKKCYGVNSVNKLKRLLNISYRFKFIFSLNKKYLDWIHITKKIRVGIHD